MMPDRATIGATAQMEDGHYICIPVVVTHYWLLQSGTPQLANFGYKYGNYQLETI